ncbi:hypothetical protein [Staphylococcus aureus]|uniref:hypothetical protein n=6 Tax=Staphylococcus aureus TaxID=1280 RepID=UPI000DA89F1B|nr:hypothetical protein C7Q48_12350 [Staphylococcus aureus]
MIKKIFTKKHVFLVIEDENHNHSDAVFGKSILLSIYVGVNKKTNSKSGKFIYLDRSKRIVRQSDITKIESANENDVDFYNLLKKEKEIHLIKSKLQKNHLNQYFHFEYMYLKWKVLISKIVKPVS